MRVVFLGFQNWGCTTLRALLDAGHDVRLVFTHRRGRHEYEQIFHDSVEVLAERAGVPVVRCRSVNGPAAVRRIAEVRPDVLVCSNWRTWVSPEVLRIPRFGGVNLHDSLLPRYGGFAPVNWAIARGESETGVTAHLMNEEFDLGDILFQRRVPIGPDDTAIDVVARTMPLFADLAVHSLDALQRGTARPVPQDPSAATFFHKRSERDSRIDWSRPRCDVHNLVRAQADPYPNAYTFHDGRRLLVKSTALPARRYCGTPGRVFRRVTDGVVVLCGDPGDDGQGLIVRVVQPDGAEPVAANDYFDRMGSVLGF